MERDENIEDWRGEPETTDVYAEQGASDWSREERSDDRLSPKVRKLLDAPEDVKT